MSKKKMLYDGKAKTIFEGPTPDTVIQYFKDDATANNAEKHAIIDGKGVLNNSISDFLMRKIQEIGIPTHYIKKINMREQLVKKVEIIPVEFVVRNIAAGTLANRLGMTEGTILRRPIIEYYYKNDDLNDPLVTEEHIEINNWASNMEIAHATETAFRINDFLIGLFRGVGIKLVDFKLEFGRIWKNDDCKIILADEISPDTCRLWDLKDEKKLDKDRFRRDLGGLVEAYTEVAKRLGIMPEGSNIMEIKSGVSKTIKLKKR